LFQDNSSFDALAISVEVCSTSHSLFFLSLWNPFGRRKNLLQHRSFL
jgi:hypothetical protein